MEAIEAATQNSYGRVFYAKGTARIKQDVVLDAGTMIVCLKNQKAASVTEE